MVFKIGGVEKNGGRLLRPPFLLLVGYTAMLQPTLHLYYINTAHPQTYQLRKNGWCSA